MDRLHQLQDELLDFEAKVDEIIQYVENEPPEIVLENLGLVKSLLSNCRSHIFLKTEETREDQENNISPKESSKRCKESKRRKSKELVDKIKNLKQDVEDEDSSKDFFPDIEPEDLLGLEDDCKREAVEMDLDDTAVFDASLEDNSDSEKSSNNSSKKFRCDICQRKFQTRRAVVVHKQTFDHELVKCPVCFRYFQAKRDVTRHMQKHTGQSLFCCDICGKGMSSKEYMIWHKENIHGQSKKESFSCEVCGKSFNHERYLKQHMKVIHIIGRPWACDQCGYTFNLKQSFDKHMMIHNQDKPFECDMCRKPKFFRTLSDLEAHQVIHSGVRPFKCEECGATFARKRTLFQHYRVIHKMKKGKEYHNKQMNSELDDMKEESGFAPAADYSEENDKEDGEANNSDGGNETFENDLQQQSTFSVNDVESNHNKDVDGYPSNIIYPSQPIEPADLV